MVKRKGQLKIQQMSFMLLAVTLFFVMMGLFILAIKFQGIKEGKIELDEKNALLLVNKLANSPEFSCGEGFEREKINCIDSDKLMALKQNIKEYSKFWGVSDIEVRKIYPSEVEKECNLGNYPNCNVIRILADKTSGTYYSNFASLCRKEAYKDGSYNKCEIAIIGVSYG